MPPITAQKLPVVELQARFDEEANIHWAKRLTEAGVHVISFLRAWFSKIHAKLPHLTKKRATSWYAMRGIVGTG